jgi:hypothetical protein
MSVHPSLDLLKEKPKVEVKVEEKVEIESLEPQSREVIEKLKDFRETQKKQKEQITEIKTLVETIIQEDAQLDALEKEALQLLIKRLKG